MRTFTTAGLAARYAMQPKAVLRLLREAGIRPVDGPGRGGAVAWGEDARAAIRCRARPKDWPARWRAMREANRPEAMLAARLAAAELRALARYGDDVSQRARLRLVAALSRFAEAGQFVEVDGAEYAYADDASIRVREAAPLQSACR